jgi:hypothetical protein
MEGRARIEVLKCERCLYTWMPRGGKLPMTCPKCRTPYWKTKRLKKEKRDDAH